MLKVDLGQLQRKGRIRIDTTVAADSAVLEGTAAEFPDGLEVRLEAQQAGRDVLVRGSLRGTAEQECRRCLRQLRAPVDEEVLFLYRSGVEAVEAQAEEVYPLAAKARELDLTDAVREHLILAVPAYPLCDEVCRGLCPRCGADLNQGPCGCEEAPADPRWAALRQNRE